MSLPTNLGPGTHRNILNPPKLVLLDLKLLKVSGLQVFEQLKSNPATKAIPVAILTAAREELDLVESYRHGVNSYIQKPVDCEQFRKTVKQASLFWLVVNQPPPAAFQEK